MWRINLDDLPRKPADDEPQTEPRVLSSEFFSGPRLARRRQVLQEMRGRMHRGHR